jgi:hypothetical protein
VADDDVGILDAVLPSLLAHVIVLVENMAVLMLQQDLVFCESSVAVT